MVTIRSFLHELSVTSVPPGFVNPYTRPEASHNLRLFLEAHTGSAPHLLLIGEAPGYRGATLSGVPLCSLHLLTHDWDDPWSMFGPSMGYKQPANVSFTKEATSSIVWSVLADCFPNGPAPLTWNAIPFQPFSGSVYSNASLRKSEIELGRKWLWEFLELFSNSILVAVGARADEALSELEINHHHVRHPSRGGKCEFIDGLIELKTTLKHLYQCE